MIVVGERRQIPMQHAFAYNLVCGNPAFTNQTRRGLFRNMDGMGIEFAETEFRPQF